MTTCGQVVEACVCKLADVHDDAHACACGGSWTFDGAGNFVIIRMPGDSPDPEFAADNAEGLAFAELFRGFLL